MIEIIGKHTTAKIMIDNVEETAISQITQFVNNQNFTNPIAIMCDVHAGKGAVIGFTMQMTKHIIPNIIGMDGSCGMLLVVVKDLFKNISIEDLEKHVRKVVPFGMNVHQKTQSFKWDWKAVDSIARQFAYKYTELFNNPILSLVPNYSDEWLKNKCKQIGADHGRVMKAIGSLGSGNHFVEVGKIIEKVDVEHTITIHSGSRNFGKMICEYWQKKAEETPNDTQQKIKELIDSAKTDEEKRALSTKIQVIKNQTSCHKDLMCLNERDSIDYLFDMIFVNFYARKNREVMMNLIMEKVQLPVEETIETIHNFIDFEDLIIRKGAVPSYIGKKFILPFNMRDGLLICEGKSNPVWNSSAPHGAGRVLSRSKAKQTLSLENFEKQMEGIYSTSVVASVLDESPDAYKDSKVIEDAIAPTANILYRSKPVINLKSRE